jgi:hypothetical protein
MRIRGWLIIGGEEAARGLPHSAALVGPSPTPVLPDAATVEPGRWILWAPTDTHLRPQVAGAYPSGPICLVCVEVPIT